MEDSKKLSKKLDSKKFNFFFSPMLEIREVSYKYKNFTKCDLFLFTSKNGLRNFKHHKKESTTIVIGNGTLSEAKKMGLKNLINIDGNIEDLKKVVILELKNYSRILHPTSSTLDKNLYNFFKSIKCNYHPLTCYSSEKKNTNPEVFENFFFSCKDGIITLFSKRTAMAFVKELNRFNLIDKCNQMKLLVLSKVIEEELTKQGFKNILITSKPNEESMINLINQISSQRSLIE